MAVVRRSALAEQDYRDIWRYIAADNPDAADRLLRRIDSKLELYAQNPQLGTARSRAAKLSSWKLSSVLPDRAPGDRTGPRAAWREGFERAP